MTTKVPVELSSTPGIVDGSNATAITIGSDELVTFSTGITSTAAANTLGATSFSEADLTNVGTIYADQYLGDADTDSGIVLPGSDIMTFHTANSERMRIDSSGNLLVGTTQTPLTLLSDGHSGFGVSGADDYIVSSRFNGASGYFKRENSNGSVLEFLRDASNVGSITVTTTATAFNTSSDYRLKENVDYTWDATTRLKQLKPARFNFIADETNTLVDGFLAHEVSSIVPEAITGEKDAVDSEGNPEYQGIDQSKLVPLLVKTIQELEARITTLEG